MIYGIIKQIDSDNDKYFVEYNAENNSYAIGKEEKIEQKPKPIRKTKLIYTTKDLKKFAKRAKKNKKNEAEFIKQVPLHPRDRVKETLFLLNMVIKTFQVFR